LVFSGSLPLHWWVKRQPIMNKPTRSIEWIVWGGLALVILTILGAYVASSLGTFHRPPLPVLSQVSNFALTNQFGRTVTLANLRGQVWVADIIFTRCPGPCTTMSRAMRELQSALPPTQPVQLISLTADSEFDTPEVLKTYGEKFGAAPGRWQFLTGKKLDLYQLATKGLLLAVDDIKADERTSPDDLFVHSTRFVVVDKHGRVRGSFDGAEPASVRKLVEAVQTLLREDP
jgi:protein SCO1